MKKVNQCWFIWFVWIAFTHVCVMPFAMKNKHWCKWRSSCTLRCLNPRGGVRCAGRSAVWWIATHRWHSSTWSCVVTNNKCATHCLRANQVGTDSRALFHISTIRSQRAQKCISSGLWQSSVTCGQVTFIPCHFGQPLKTIVLAPLPSVQCAGSMIYVPGNIGSWTFHSIHESLFGEHRHLSLSLLNCPMS